MKRSPLRRSTPLRARVPWRPERTPLARASLRPTSDARKAENAERAMRAAVLGRATPCALCPGIRLLDRSWTGCTGRAEHWHERRKASAGGSRTLPANLVAACDPGNGYVEDEPAIAALVVLLDGRTAVVRPGHPEFDALGKRASR